MPVLRTTWQKQCHWNHAQTRASERQPQALLEREQTWKLQIKTFPLTGKVYLIHEFKKRANQTKAPNKLPVKETPLKTSKKHFWSNRLTKSKLLAEQFFIYKQFNPVRWTNGAAAICTSTCLKQIILVCFKKDWKRHSKAQLAPVQAMGQLSVVLSAYTAPQAVFPLPFPFFHHVLKTSPASSSLHFSLKNQAHFIPLHQIYHWSWGSKKKKKKFSFQTHRHFLAYEKTSSLLNCLLPNQISCYSSSLNLQKLKSIVST